MVDHTTYWYNLLQDMENTHREHMLKLNQGIRLVDQLERDRHANRNKMYRKLEQHIKIKYEKKLQRAIVLAEMREQDKLKACMENKEKQYTRSMRIKTELERDNRSLRRQLALRMSSSERSGSCS